jgi:hypothetical protein
MRNRSVLFASAFSAFLLGSLATAAVAQQNRRQEQVDLRQDIRKGSIQSLRQIETNVVPAMKRRGADYIGAEYDSAALRYRLKFVRQTSVIWIDVDGRSGAIVARAGD